MMIIIGNVQIDAAVETYTDAGRYYRTMEMETRARDLVITDMRDYHAFRRYARKEIPSIVRPIRALWKEQAEIVTVETTKIALQSGVIPPEWKTPWERMIREFVRDDMAVQWVKNISIAGDIIARKVNRPERKQFDFDSTMTSVKSWVDNSGGRLIADLTTAQMGSTQALLQHQIALQVTSPYVLSQRIKPLVGLTNRETMAVAKFMATLQEQGVSPAMINRQVANYSKFLHKNRAARIARTEISDAFNFGQLNAISQAVQEGHLPGVPEKSWIAGGANPCDICLDNEAIGPIALPDVFPSGDEHPTAHPQCECAVGYKVRRGVGERIGDRRPYRITVTEPRLAKAGPIANTLKRLPRAHTWKVDSYYVDTAKKMAQDAPALGRKDTIAGYWRISDKSVHINAAWNSPQVVFHEVGHAVYDTGLVTSAQKSIWNVWYFKAKGGRMKYPTPYALENSSEFFAECYSQYYLRRYHLIDPKIKVWFDKTFKGGP